LRLVLEGGPGLQFLLRNRFLFCILAIAQRKLAAVRWAGSVDRPQESVSCLLIPPFVSHFSRIGCMSTSFKLARKEPRNNGPRTTHFKEIQAMGKKLYVGNLSYNVDSSELEQMFAPHGQVVSAQIINDRDTGRSKGFGFVEMANDNEAEAAIAALNGHEHEGRALTVNEARPREERPRGGGGGYGGGGGGGRGGYGGGGGGGGRGGYGGGGGGRGDRGDRGGRDRY